MADNPPGPFQQPKGSRIERIQPSPDTLIYRVPRGRRGLSLIVFGVLWNLFILPLFYFVVVKGGGLPKEVVVPRVIISAMAVAGLFMLYTGLRQRLSSYLLYLSPEFVRLRRRFILARNQELPTRAIQRVQRVEDYTTQSGSEEAPVTHVTFAIELRAGVRTLRFGSGLEEAEQHWLAWEIREYLGRYGAELL